MGKIIVTLTSDVEKKLRETAKTRYGNKRGALSIIVEDALKDYLVKQAIQDSTNTPRK